MWAPTVKDIEQVVKQADKLLSIREDATVAEAAKKMSANQVGCLVVFDCRGKFAGVLTERDMLAKVLTTSLSPDSVPVRNIMTTEAISCSMETTIEKAEQLMAEHKIRHLPIVEDGVPAGMISSRDTIAYRLRSNKAMKGAAEQLAMLSTGLKSLDFDDVVALAINEIPRSFEAERAVVCFAEKGASAGMVYRKGCQLSEKEVLALSKRKKLCANEQVICGDACKVDSKGRCKVFDNLRQCQVDKQTERLTIPLRVYEGTLEDAKSADREGFLCMCGFNISSVGSEKPLLYKASLVKELLSVNLTNAKLYQNYQKARRDSETDPLTGVGTRRVLENVLKAECARAARYHNSFSIAIIDIDNFKKINDSAGHAAGDEALQQLAKMICSNIRKTDVPARYGGDEFVLLMPETRLNEASILLERLRVEMKNASIAGVPSITISCGAAEWSGEGDTSKEMLKRADAALYEAKRHGRNRVVSSP